MRGAAPAILIVTGIAVACTVRGRGPFGGTSPVNRLVMLQVFLSVAALTALVLGAAIAERNTAERRRMADYDIARVMARSATLEEAAPEILKSICARLNSGNPTRDDLRTIAGDGSPQQTDVVVNAAIKWYCPNQAGRV